MTSRHPARGRDTLCGALLVLLVLLVLLALPSASAHAQAARVRMHVTALSGVLGPESDGGDDGSFDLEVRMLVENVGDEPVTDLTVLVEAFGAVSSRSVLHHAVDDASPTNLLEDEIVDVAGGDALDPGAVAAVSVTIPSERVGWGNETAVHPLRISVLQGREALDEGHTAVVVLAGVPQVPLRTVVGWPFDAPPWRHPDGTFPAEAPAEIRQGGRLERLVWALEQHDTPVQPLVAAHVVEDLADMADGYRTPDGARVPAEEATAARSLVERLRTLLGESAARPIAGPYADAHLSALLDAGLRGEALQEVSEGRRRLEEVLRGRPLPDAVWVTSELTRDALREVLVPSRTRTLVMSWSQLAGDEMPSATPPAVRLLRTGGVQMQALVADPWLEDLLAGLPPFGAGVLEVQRLLAETALIHLEYPFDADRGLVLLAPRDWNPDPRVAEDVLAGLLEAPWLELSGVGALLDNVTPDDGFSSLGVGDGPELPESVASELAPTREGLAALQAALPDNTAGVGERSWRDLERTLLRAPSSWWLHGRVSWADEHVQAVRDAVSRGFGPVSLPANTRVTLTDTEGTIPITVARGDGPPLDVVVQLDAPPRLEFPEGASRELRLEPGGSHTISFPTVAQASGRIPVTVRVLSGGATDAPPVELAQDTVVVQSMAISRTALLVLGGVLVLLLAWWVYRRLRPRRPELHVVDGEARPLHARDSARGNR